LQKKNRSGIIKKWSGDNAWQGIEPCTQKGVRELS